MYTPALVINDKVVSYDKTLNEDEVKNLLEQGGVNKMRKPKVAFICVHNSCRSQIAEALGKKYASDVFESYSAGTQIKKQINQDAIRLMKDIYNIDMERTQYSKLIDDLPDIDISITMGCDVVCPIVENQYTEDWHLEDPTGLDDEFFKKIISKIEKNIKDLSLRIKKNEISLNENRS